MTDVPSDADLALRVVALAALGDTIDDGRPRAAAAPPSRRARERDDLDGDRPPGRRRARAAESRPGDPGCAGQGGGFPWSKGGIPDSNDTAAAIEALRAAGVGAAPIRRALVALRTFQNRDGGFALTKGRESDAQSTAWAIQALISAGQKPGKPPFRYLSRLRRADGSYRYSVRYGTTPVWVTAQVVPALAGKPFPLR